MTAQSHPQPTSAAKATGDAQMLNKRLIIETPIANVYTVNGAHIRNVLDVDWIGGGHNLVYWWTPRGEAWVEASLGSDARFVAAHELSEIFDMLTKRWKYDKAHAKANRVEKAARNAWRHGYRSSWEMLGAIRSVQPYCADVIADVICSWPSPRGR